MVRAETVEQGSRTVDILERQFLGRRRTARVKVRFVGAECRGALVAAVVVHHACVGDGEDE
ncbi:hypothetical protein D3C85_1797420 [compost metagenome]